MRMRCAITQYYREKILAERRVAYLAAGRLSLAELWHAPAVEGWSAGQNFEHLIRCLRFSRGLLTPALPSLRPKTGGLGNLPYEPYIDNPYHKEDRKMSPPPGTSLGDRNQAPQSLEKLKHDLEDETDKLVALTGDLPVEVMGRISFSDPLIGRMNLVQSFQVFFFHEHHHLRFVHRLLARRRSKQSSKE